MAAQKGAAGSRGISDETVKARTGMVWHEWFRLLEEWGAGRNGHKAAAEYLGHQHRLSGWWAQTVVVRYEWEQGRRGMCTMRFGEKVLEGEALLDAGQLIFSAEQYRLAIPTAKVSAIKATKGQLAITFSRGLAVFDLGRDAQKWASRLRL